CSKLDLCGDQNDIRPTFLFRLLICHCVNGDINITSILEKADDPCDLNQDLSNYSPGSYDLETLRNILDTLLYACDDLFSHYDQLFGCNNVDGMQTVKEEMNLSDATTLSTDVKTYYTWLLWAQEAELHMNSSSSMRNPSFEFLKLDETVNSMMQLACLMFDPDLESTVELPQITSTDPVDYRFRSCVIFESVRNFTNATLDLPLERSRRSSYRGHHIRPYKVLDLNPSPLQYNEDIQTTTKPMVPIPDSQLINLWTHIKVGRNRRQLNNARGIMGFYIFHSPSNIKISDLLQLLCKWKFPQTWCDFGTGLSN
ncbi:hypothetical protein LOTGIDRAFT_174016, partial [Lottia gigantea]